MPTILAHHNLTKGSKHWLTSPKRKEFFGPLGVTNIRTFVDPQNPNRAAVMMDVPDMDALTAAMQTKAAAAKQRWRDFRQWLQPPKRSEAGAIFRTAASPLT